MKIRMSMHSLVFWYLCLVHVSCCFCFTNFAFGDSIVDAGNNNYLPSLSKADYSPYGIDFTPSGGKPTGRYTNGFTIVGRIPLRMQIKNFERSRAEMVKTMGENSTRNFLKDAIFSLTIGSNDIITYFLPNLPFRLHELGARKMVIVDVGPLGCIPFVRAIHLLPEGECHEEMNTLIRGYNEKLRVAVHRLNQEIGMDSIFVYANSYDVINGILQNYGDYGFENVNDPCCGGYFPPFFCFRIGDEKEISSSLCEDRSKYLFWDSYHPGQAANFIIAQQMLNGDESICSPINVRQLHSHKL
ncbi:Lipase, GDSL [Cynara cardunculus var. scolymus]|uniref:Lipase, GDSL n=1 Tax=Cynara cardunculus var. scolymus TaxID=59895 RepID=A0A103UZT5_CYNCS|nr:Lipase, GDSL [Cynara cardunculus var. scolymus]